MTIKGIAWDHRRCWGPLDASIAPYAAATGQQVAWDRRSLYSFGEGDLSEFCARYDLVIYDHPFVGQAAAEGWLLDLAPLLAAADRDAFAADEVGPSWRSYAFEGGIYALPIDTAAQTAAWRPDLLDDEERPGTLDGVYGLAERLGRRGRHIAWPAVPTDQLCTLITIGASLGGTPGRSEGPFMARADVEAAVDWMRRLLAVAHPGSAGWNPIRCLDHMSAQDDVAYVPWLFNYVNYQTPPRERPIRFGASPRVDARIPARTILGGAGIGVSRTSADPQAAFDYAMYLSRPAFQAGDYVRHGGQPGSRTAWTSDACNALTGGFFRDTLPVLDASYLRPTYPGFLTLFHEATARLDAVLREGAPAAAFADWLNGEHARRGAAAQVGVGA